MKYILYIFLFLFILPQKILAQNEGILQLNDELHAFLSRQQTRGLLPQAFLNHQPLSGADVNTYLNILETKRAELSDFDKMLLDRFLNKRQNRSTQKYNRALPFLYNKSNAFYELKEPNNEYAVQLNPMINWSFGQGSFSSDSEESNTKPMNRRTQGVRASGHIGKSLFFEARITGNLEDLPYPEPQSLSAQRVGFVKNPSANQIDYFQATGMIGYKSKYIEARFGRDRNRWGEGLNSTFLSNYAPVYDQLQIRTTLGKVQYVNLFTAMNDVSRWAGGDTPMPRKFGTFHSLSIRPFKALELNVFESVIFTPIDLTNLRRFDYDISYLNPIIFYRAVEHDRGSPDNALVGAGGSLIPIKGVKLYGQLLLDEFVWSNIKAKNGWWANKWAILAGLHFVPSAKMEARLEYGRSRPFMYSHSLAYNAYTHHNSNLGHQTGANANEYLFYLNYQPSARTIANFTATYRQGGRNPLNKNYGANPNLAATNFVQEFGNEIGQGISENNLLIESRLGWEWIAQCFFEGGIRYQTVEDGEKGNYGYVLPFIQIRWGIPFQYQRY